MISNRKKALRIFSSLQVPVSIDDETMEQTQVSEKKIQKLLTALLEELSNKDYNIKRLSIGNKVLLNNFAITRHWDYYKQRCQARFFAMHYIWKIHDL